jgi:hypothetical protein
VDAAAGHGLRQRPVEHHVADCDQVVVHARSVN